MFPTIDGNEDISLKKQVEIDSIYFPCTEQSQTLFEK